MLLSSGEGIMGGKQRDREIAWTYFTEIAGLRSLGNGRKEYSVHSVSEDQLVYFANKRRLFEDWAKKSSYIIAIRSSDREVRVAKIEWTSAVSEDRSRLDSTEHKNALIQSVNDGKKAQKPASHPGRLF